MAANDPVLVVTVFDNGDVSIEHSMEKPFDEIHQAHLKVRSVMTDRIVRIASCPHFPETPNAQRH